MKRLRITLEDDTELFNCVLSKQDENGDWKPLSEADLGFVKFIHERVHFKNDLIEGYFHTTSIVQALMFE